MCGAGFYKEVVMPSLFPGQVDTFTTKIDNVHDIMADHVNDLQNSIVAVQSHLIPQLTGWIKMWVNPVYGFATTVVFNGNNFWTFFPVGTKIKFIQGGQTKYFYVISAAYSGGNTTVTVTGGSDYSVANQPITEFHIAHGTAFGFPEWFNWTPTQVGWVAPPTGVFKFKLEGKTCSVMIYQSGGQTSNDATTSISVPVASKIGTYYESTAQAIDNSVILSNPARGQIGNGSSYINFSKNFSGDPFAPSGHKQIITCSIHYEIN